MQRDTYVYIYGDNMQCNRPISSYPDNFFGIGIGDPPYGIGYDKKSS